jgi:hypothetical protein
MKIIILSKVISAKNESSELSGGMIFKSQEIEKISVNQTFPINETILAHCKVLRICNKTLFVELEKYKFI